MPIDRGHPTKNYTKIDNRVLRDGRLGGKEQGLLVSLLAHCPTWKIIIPLFMTKQGYGRNKTYSVLNHLCKEEVKNEPIPSVLS